MFSKILIANRGEIALRIIRACKELGIRTVAVFSEADRDASFVHLADEDICIGPSASADSYLKMERIIAAAEITDAEAIHPGYGFLAENPEFAEICESCNIKFIGPDPRAIRLMGDKNNARITMIKNNVPVVPGSKDCIKNEKHALKVAHEIGFPVIIKASAGGGGKGMRIAHTDVALTNAYLTARTEAEKAFGNPEVYIEKYIENPRHIEFQILADEHGNYLHLGERECSIQRRHQKLVEEAPSPIINRDLREKMGQAAVKAAKAADYFNAGTVEFIMDDKKNYYFIEMNTRIQVEHPITEEITGIDLIKEQIKIASGEKLMFKQKDIKFHGHAIECRINAEDPEKNFRPSPGKVHNIHLPGGPGVRVDTYIYPNFFIPTFYDSLFAKLIVWAESRPQAISRMQRSLEEFKVDGVKTTIDFLKMIIRDDRFKKGNYSTKFIENFF